MLARPRVRILAALAVLALASGCPKRVDEYESTARRDPESPRERCRAAFAACAPPARFGSGTDVDALDVRTLVHVSSRLDVPDRLAADAAARLLGIARRADGAALLDIQDAIENTGYALAKCRCDGFPPEIEKKGIPALVASRAPPRALRSPEHWADRMLTEIRALQALSRRSAMAAVGGDSGGEDVLAAQQREAERGLCDTVHAARSALAPAAFDESVALVYRKRLAEAGEGSAEIARGAVARYAASPSCEAAAP